jgi:hypothetical protein
MSIRSFALKLYFSDLGFEIPEKTVAETLAAYVQDIPAILRG